MDDINNGEYDPDLEARLYGEVYYTNDTFPQHNETNFQQYLPLPQQVLVQQRNQPYQYNHLNEHYNGRNWQNNNVFNQQSAYSYQQIYPRYRPSYDVMYSNKERAHREMIPSFRPGGRPSNDPSYSHRQYQRHCALRAINIDYTKRPANNSFNHSRNNSSNSSRSTAQISNHSIQKNIEHSQPKSKRINEVVDNFLGNTVGLIQTVLDNESNGNNAENQANEIDNSKYNVAEKQKQLNTQEVNGLEDPGEDSDSDQSIFEIPVPPKPKPLLINLRDSGESSGGEDNDKGVENPVVVLTDNSDLSCGDTNLENNKQASSNVNVNINDEKCTDVNVSQESIILNCTQVQRGAASLEDIRRIRETIVGSDDSMTDSEALNWGHIEGQIIGDNCMQDEDYIHGQSSKVNSDQYYRLKGQEAENSNVTNVSNTVTDNTTITSPAAKATQSDPKWNSAIKNTDNGNSIINFSITISNEYGQETPRSLKSKKRIRNDRSLDKSISESHDNEEATPSKRANNNVKSTVEMSFEEYVFQPMPKKLEVLYSTFRGEEFMKDLTHVQHRMSKNPSRWAILDEDIIGPRPGERRKRCGLCQTEGHKRDKCPQKQRIIVCHMCGESGHLESRCPYKMCLTCGTKYSSYRKTCENCRNLICSTCKSLGHLSTNCPDLWRRYHHTVDNNDINIPPDPQIVLKTSNKLICCNCTKRGHDSSTCTRYRWSQHFVTPRFVTNYDMPPFYTTNANINIQPTELISKDNKERRSENQIERKINKSLEDKSSTPLRNSSIPSRNSSTPSKNSNTASIDLNTPINTDWRVLYHYISPRATNTIRWSTERIFPYKIQGISYKFDKNLPAIPNFLMHHVPPSIFYELTISEIDKNNFMFKLRALNRELLAKLRKLVVQWLHRPDDDKILMTNAERLPVKPSELINILKLQWDEFNRNKYPKGYTLLKKMRNIKMELQSKKCKKSVANVLILQLKRKLVSFVYNFSLAPNAQRICQEFQELLTKLRDLPIIYHFHVPLELYLEALWFHFELFTPHTSKYIIKAVKLCEESKDPTKIDKSKIDEPQKLNVWKEDADVSMIDLTESDDFEENGLPIDLEEIDTRNIITDDEDNNDDGKKCLSKFGRKRITRSKINNNNNNNSNKQRRGKACDYRVLPDVHNIAKKPGRGQQLFYANAMLAYVEKNNMKTLKKRAKRLVKMASGAKLSKDHLVKFSSLIKITNSRNFMVIKKNA